MGQTLVIFKKELRGFLTSPYFLLVCGVCAVILSWNYFLMLKDFAGAIQNQVYQMQASKQHLNIHYAVFLRHLSNVNLLLILVVPAMTFRLFAEEKKMRTFDLLLTSPITSLQIVLGKYLAILAVIFVIMLIALLYPVASGFFVNIHWLNLAIAFFGIFLVGAVYAAMNLFCSSLTESAVAAIGMAVISNIAIWFVGMGVEVVDSSVARKIFEHISLNQHLSGLVEGTVRTSTLVFFVSMVFLFTFLSERVVESSRWR